MIKTTATLFVIGALTANPILPGELASASVQRDPIPELLAEISPARIHERVEALVGFHNRNSFGDPDDATQGVGAAWRWIEEDLRRSAAGSGGRLEVAVQRFPASVRRRRESVEGELVNVYGFLPGAQGDPLGRTYVVAGHYDSRATHPFDTESFAPGADDDASGTAVVLELARVISRMEFEANLVFLCVSGEEQGLFGSKHFAEQAAADGLAIDGMITNDIVGGIEGGNGVVDEQTLRVFSGAEGLHSDSRELARLVHDVAARYVPEARVKLIFRLDRFGRGGDHIPFHERGLPAVRFTEANEHYDRQHQDVREEGGVEYGDLLEHVSAEYMALVARVNGAALANLALAPPPPTQVEMRGAVRHDAELRWEPAVEGTRHVVLWRDTTAPLWEHRFEPVTEPRFVADGVTADDCFLAVRAVNALGHESRAVLPATP